MVRRCGRMGSLILFAAHRDCVSAALVVVGKLY